MTRLPLHLALLSITSALATAWIPTPTPPQPRRRSPTTTTTNSPRLPHMYLAAVKTDEELLPVVREGIAEKQATSEWQECVKFLATDLDVSEEQAEIWLAHALEWRGWARVTSALARKYMDPQLPDLKKLRAALTWLREGPLGLTDLAVLREAIEKSPKAYLVDPEAAYREALDTAPPQLKDPEAFKELLLDDPTVLECSYNCVDDGCNSECGNCWVSYQIKRGQRAMVEF